MPSPVTSAEQRKKLLGVLLRVGVFALIAALGYYFVFPLIIAFLGAPVFVISTLGTFAAAAVANTLALRIYERGNLSDIGLGWTAASRRNLSLGMLGGIGAALAVVVLPLALRVADFEPVPNERLHWPSLLFVSILLLFGAVGEEMLFRGYGFQVLVKGIGPFATILPVAVLFGLAHSQNLNFGPLALFNTILWGVVLGYRLPSQRRSLAAHRSALWLEFGVAIARRKSQRVYNGCYRVRDALEDRWSLKWRRLWPGRRFAHHRCSHRLVLLRFESPDPAPGSDP